MTEYLAARLDHGVPLTVVDGIEVADTDAADATMAEAKARIEALEADVERLRAIAEDKLADTRLVSAGPVGGDGFGFDLMGGPIPYIAEYLFQFIGARDDDKPTSNYAEIEVNHREFGAMTLTMQRRSGQTPHQLRQAAEARCKRLEEALSNLLPLIYNESERGIGWRIASEDDAGHAWDGDAFRAARLALQENTNGG